MYGHIFEDGIIACPFCTDKLFSSKKNLVEHIEKLHLNQKIFFKQEKVFKFNDESFGTDDTEQSQHCFSPDIPTDIVPDQNYYDILHKGK